jgi:hypothetical protein
VKEGTRWRAHAGVEEAIVELNAEAADATP